MAGHKKSVALGCCFLAVTLVGGWLVFFGPASEETSFCEVCGLEKVTHTFLGIRLREVEQETTASQWYEQTGMKVHPHQWSHMCSWERAWGGAIDTRDSLTWETGPLRLLKSAARHVDEEVAADLIREYETTQQDPAARAALLDRCNAIVQNAARARNSNP